MTVLKGFLYGMTSGENSHFAQIDKILEGMNKFGLMSPFPLLYPRISLTQDKKGELSYPNLIRRPSKVLEQGGLSPSMNARTLNETSRGQGMGRTPKAQAAASLTIPAKQPSQELKPGTLSKTGVRLPSASRLKQEVDHLVTNSHTLETKALEKTSKPEEERVISNWIVLLHSLLNITASSERLNTMWRTSEA